MKALVWHGKYHVSVDTVPDPVIQEPTDAIIKITSTAICGSDLHMYEGRTNVEKGKELLAKSDLKYQFASSMDEAAKTVVAAAKEAQA